MLSDDRSQLDLSLAADIAAAVAAYARCYRERMFREYRRAAPVAKLPRALFLAFHRVAWAARQHQIPVEELIHAAFAVNRRWKTLNYPPLNALTAPALKLWHAAWLEQLDDERRGAHTELADFKRQRLVAGLPDLAETAAAVAYSQRLWAEAQTRGLPVEEFFRLYGAMVTPFWLVVHPCAGSLREVALRHWSADKRLVLAKAEKSLRYTRQVLQKAFCEGAAKAVRYAPGQA